MASSQRALIERSEAYFGGSDPDNIWLRSLHLLLTGSSAEAARRLEEACAGVDAGRCGAYRSGFRHARAVREKAS